MKRAISALMFAIGWVCNPVSAFAQSVDDVLANADAKTQQIQKVLQVLQSGDQATQYALVEALLKDEDKALKRIGREHALFSPQPVLQNMAIESVFETSPQVRMVMTNPNAPKALQWLQVYGGAQDGETGFVMMPVGKFDERAACWLDPTFKRCRFTVIGSSVQFQMYANGGQSINRGSAALTLQPDGRLVGAFATGFGTAQLSIDLKE